MKLLSIGNSFSHDAHKWLHQIAESVGEDICCANLYIGGCSLETHWKNFQSGADEYDYEINGEFQERINLPKALVKENWDVITLQQASGFSGIFSSFEPYLSNLLAEIKKVQPNAKIYLHKTWSYDTGSGHPDFKNYNFSEREMYDAITEAYNDASEKTGLPIIPTGDAVQYIRENVKEFDMKNGGMTLTRDSFHLSYIYGRFVGGLVWLKALTGIDADKVTFVPKKDGYETDERIIETLKRTITELG